MWEVFNMEYGSFGAGLADSVRAWTPLIGTVLDKKTRDADRASEDEHRKKQNELAVNQQNIESVNSLFNVLKAVSIDPTLAPIAEEMARNNLKLPKEKVDAMFKGIKDKESGMYKAVNILPEDKRPLALALFATDPLKFQALIDNFKVDLEIGERIAKYNSPEGTDLNTKNIIHDGCVAHWRIFSGKSRTR